MRLRKRPRNKSSQDNISNSQQELVSRSKRRKSQIIDSDEEDTFDNRSNKQQKQEIREVGNHQSQLQVQVVQGKIEENLDDNFDDSEKTHNNINNQELEVSEDSWHPSQQQLSETAQSDSQEYQDNENVVYESSEEVPSQNEQSDEDEATDEDNDSSDQNEDMISGSGGQAGGVLCLWCSECSQYIPIDSFSQKEQTNPKHGSKGRFCLKHYIGGGGGQEHYIQNMEMIQTQSQLEYLEKEEEKRQKRLSSFSELEEKLGEIPISGETLIGFGKFRDKTYQYVLSYEQSYVRWLKKQNPDIAVIQSQAVRDFLAWVERFEAGLAQQRHRGYESDDGFIVSQNEDDSQDSENEPQESLEQPQQTAEVEQMNDQILQFGKHRGETFAHVFETDPSYCDFIVREATKDLYSTSQFAFFADWVLEQLGS
eukprot:TRINITY_DN8113_c0_g4_i2.p1 TRINITY_DN8113_c0_g4~~TRINITY_DN8113_c0_g4_i2.p1  ORF type:complete len:425 (+),score=54.89 TRINITY_DN8113_c0_g4_i2:138-1412(+)